ncbi:ribonuclease H [Camelimonas fluminis]|uniref:ribonuclease H n=1 Tax=Camelimonas fluminis TaxID=1576911 RepID=A0ABV7UCH5_9HYPH
MMVIYADGACSGNPGPAAAAILVLEHRTGGMVQIDQVAKHLGQGTNQTAELHAALMAIEAAAASNETEFLVRCDSQYTVNGITSWMANWIANGWRTAGKKPVANSEIWRAINDAISAAEAAGKTIRFEWVKGHSTDQYNNKVDRLAVAACNQRAEGPSHYTQPAPKPAPARNALGLTPTEWVSIRESLVSEARARHSTGSGEDAAETAARYVLDTLLGKVRLVADSRC